MRIAYIAAGAAGMYCGSCLHDNTLAAALMAGGHEVALIPTYTPLRTDEADVSGDAIFYGAINVFLQQKWRWFRDSPRIVDRLLDRPGLLRWVSRFSASTNARELGALTLSILRAEAGFQQKELHRLIDFLTSFRPDIVQLTNGMFLGIGVAIRRRLRVPVVSGLTGEDLFLNELSEPFRSRVQEEMIQRAREIDGFIATSRYYADAMRDFLRITDDRMHVVPLGIRLDDFRSAPRTMAPEKPVTIGYLARICPEKGLHLLIEAFQGLRRMEGPGQIRLRIAGYLGARDREYLDQQRRRIEDWGLAGDVEILGEVDRAQKLALLREVDLFSVPTVYKEPKGLFVLESWAAGAPVVQPRHGAFPELLESSGGGLLVRPDSADALTEGLARLVADPELRLELGKRGRAAVESEHGADRMAERTVTVYESIRDRGAAR